MQRKNSKINFYQYLDKIIKIIENYLLTVGMGALLLISFTVILTGM